MTTPIADFVRRYARQNPSRLHMPGHKGRALLGCEAWDITEVPGADALYGADGIIAESEANTAALFGSRQTFYSTEGSSHCIRAMLYLAMTASGSRTVVAARNVHRAFLSAAALLDLETVWLWPEARRSLCGCPVSPQALEAALDALETPPAAVYLTSPDYLGGMADLPALAAVCHRRKVLLAVDNAHGAYLRFLSPSRHPLDLGADLCCDSAHKTLPVLTGGAYLHISKSAPKELPAQAKSALALFGSTSPSFLTLASLDLCSAQLAGDYPARLAETVRRLESLKADLRRRGWTLAGDEPLKLTLDAAAYGWPGPELAEHLRTGGVEPEYADREYCVLMASPDNLPEDFPFAADSLDCAVRKNPLPRPVLPLAKGEQVLSIREALFAPQEPVRAAESLGRICGAPTVSCPPAVPIAVSGERIGPEALALFRHYEISPVAVLRE